MSKRRAVQDVPAAPSLLRAALWLAFFLFGLGPALSQSENASASKALVLHIDGAIGPATSSYIAKGIEKAREDGAALAILRIDTPGGLDSSMRDIIRDILASPVPVATYVHPSGARAASAGTYILYASHVAAMTPGTNLGAATPVQLGGAPARPEGAEKADEEKESGDAAKAKAVNDAVAYIRSLAELRGRNADWAEAAVREAASLPASEAVAQKVVDLSVPSIEALLAAIDGRQVKVGGADMTLKTEGLALEHVEPDWRTSLLAAITDPNVALILMMIGVYGLIFEFMSPGALYPGTIGAICLLLGLYALAALPVNYAGVGLIVLGIALMLGEIFAPSFGILGIGGAVAFVLGATILIDTDAPGFALSWPLIAGLAVASLAFTLVVLRMALSAHRRKVVTGRDEMIGALAVVQDWSGGGGHVFVHSERWRALSDAALAPKQEVRVVKINGLTLTVEPLPPDRN